MAEQRKTNDVFSEIDRLKYEIAEELGLMDKVNKTGWKSLTAKESGKIGGIMTKRRKDILKEISKNYTNDPRM